MIYRDDSILQFSSEIQQTAVSHVRIFVADAIFELAPRGYQQIWFIHGLVS